MDHLHQFINNHWQLVLAFVVILVIIFIHEAIAVKKQGKTLNTAQTVEQINHHNAVVIDIRSAELFKKGHIIGAIRATLADFKLPKMNQYKEKPIVLVCARGLESPALAAKLHAVGFKQVMVLGGGLAAWQAAHLPVVKK
ncbi:MAG TPA: rhodanese-like domain-containing protein [Legionellaceae bacterium]|nr:rhodanese-like domain-containing protein [Legionellaceae bacterium]